MSQYVLEVKQLHTRLGKNQAIHAVDGLDFCIKPGETLALVGESGCGKSMTALSVMGLLPASAVRSGQIVLAGQDLAHCTANQLRQIRGAKMAMIFQEPMTSLNPVLTVGQQIAEGVWQHQRLRGKALQQRVLELMTAVGIPAPDRRSREYPHQMSGGMKQRIMIAMALAGKPDLLIADEPTTALDVTIQAQILQLLQQLQRELGMALLLITHDLGVVAQMADQVAVMYAGQIIEKAPQSVFFAQPGHPYSQKLFAALPNMAKRQHRLSMIQGRVPRLNQVFTGCRFANRCPQVRPICTEQLPPWQAQTEPQILCHFPAAIAPTETPVAQTPPTLQGAGAPLLEVQQLQIRFGVGKSWSGKTTAWVHAVDGISFTVKPGQTLALVGESGCGKSTVAKGILQLLPVTAGEIQFAGLNWRQLRGKALMQQRKKIQMIFQDAYSSMNPRMTVANIIAEGMVVQNLYTRPQRQQRVNELLQQVGLDAAAGQRYPHEFSGGQRQRICIARALAVEPELIICDEPTSALDVSVQAQILNLLQDLQHRLNLSLLFITHNIGVVAYLAHEVAVMYLGRIVEQGPVAQVLNNPQHPYTQALLAAVPDPYAPRQAQSALPGDLPSPIHPPTGCYFHPRCPQAQAICRQQYPESVRLAHNHQVSCLFTTNP